jgi:hypothetical protein
MGRSATSGGPLPVVAGITAGLLQLPRRAVVLAEGETHLHLLPHVRVQPGQPGGVQQMAETAVGR